MDSSYDFEMSAALLVANYFKTNVIFLCPYHLKSPDLEINGVIWKLKSPTGKPIKNDAVKLVRISLSKKAEKS